MERVEESAVRRLPGWRCRRRLPHTGTPGRPGGARPSCPAPWLGSEDGCPRRAGCRSTAGCIDESFPRRGETSGAAGSGTGSTTSGRFLGECLARAQVERHALPAPVVDVQLERRVGRRGGSRRDRLRSHDSPRTGREPCDSRPSTAVDRVMASSTFTFSLRIASAAKRAGGSIATSVSSCSRWFWNMSRRTPDVVVVAAASPTSPSPPR